MRNGTIFEKKAETFVISIFDHISNVLMNSQYLRGMRFFTLFLLLSTAAGKSNAQEYVPACIGFYNVENLFDTLNTENVNDEEYTPESAKRWNTERYRAKLEKLAGVIGEMGAEVHPKGCAIIGLSEIENREVVEDLIKTGPLKERNYEIVHYHSPDRRGIDVGLIYQPEYYRVYNHKSYTLKIEGRDDFFTRDQLVVSGVLDGDTVHVLVAHWPSRRGGEKRSRPMRVAAAELGRTIVDSLMKTSPNARIVYMGDLNDDPTNISVKRGLRSEARKEDALNGRMYNPMEEMYHKGIGTLAWRDTWNLFDQILISAPLASGTGGNYRYYGVRIFNKPYLRQTEGAFAGYPFRTFVGNDYKGGYSDHFPVYIILVKPISNE